MLILIIEINIKCSIVCCVLYLQVVCIILRVEMAWKRMEPSSLQTGPTGTPTICDVCTNLKPRPMKGSSWTLPLFTFKVYLLRKYLFFLVRVFDLLCGMNCRNCVNLSMLCILEICLSGLSFIFTMFLLSCWYDILYMRFCHCLTVLIKQQRILLPSYIN